MRTKILYVGSVLNGEKEIQETAREAGVDVTSRELPDDVGEDFLRILVNDWEKQGGEIILARGSFEKRLRPYARTSYVMGMQFSFDTVIDHLVEYQKQYPDFFGTEERRILMSSRKRLMINEKLVWELFHAKITNASVDDFDDEEAFLDYCGQFDLVVAGESWQEVLKKRGIQSFYQTMSIRQSMLESYKTADLIARSRRELREKSEEIQNILDNSFHAIVAVNPEGRITRGNSHLKRYFHQPAEQILGRSIYEFLPELNPEMLRKVLEDETGFFGEILTLAGTSTLVMNAFPIYSAGVVSGVGLEWDELYQVEQIEQKIKTEFYKKGLVAKYSFADIAGKSEPILETKRNAQKFARHSANILLYGESGTGKELFAQSIHSFSSRQDGPFVAVNCGAIPENLLESELFGYVGGAFTGASRNGKKGLLEMAHKGTIFLDEISEMSAAGQIRLLRVLEERVISRIGDDRVIPVDVRIIAASNRNLKKLVEEGKFREDLYYRLNVLMLKIPPLRERPGDCRILGELFLHRFGENSKKQIELTREAWDIMESYAWKGNVRQLRNFCERLVIIAEQRLLDAGYIRRQLEESYFEPPAGVKTCPPAGTGQIGREDEYQKILDALNHAGGRREEAAKSLGISKTSLWRRMKKYGISEKY